ncbi:MAG TPA: ABC transporter permease [Clostridia bacterium]
MKLNFKMTRKQFAIPYVIFLAVFVVFPLILVLVYAFMDENGGFSISNFAVIFSDGTIWVFLKSFLIALITTGVCMLIGYPIAYILSQAKYGFPKIIIFLFVLPMWVNFLLRTLSIKFLFEYVGIQMGYFTVITGLVYDFLPFMILPIYTELKGIDRSLIEASQDLGASPNKVFLKTIVPLSVPGVISGALMVFMPSMSTLAISDILSNNKIKLFGNFIDLWFTYDSWNIGSAMSLILLLMIGLSMWVTNKFSRGTTARGGLW